MNQLPNSQDKCFQALYDEYENEVLLTFKNLCGITKLNTHQVKRAVHKLIKKGLVKRETAFDEDNIIRGSGFILTYEAYRDKYNREQHP